MRKGTLTDTETLGMYEDGVSCIALCVHEGMTPHGVYSRISRERKRRHRKPAPRREAVAIDSWDALLAAVEKLKEVLR